MSQSYIGWPSLRLTVTVTLSPVVVGVPRVTMAAQSLPASAVLSPGQLMSTLPLASSTVTEKLQLPPPVEEVTVTTVVPTGKKEFEAGVAVSVPHEPVPSAASKVTCAPRTPPSVVFAVALMLVGQVRSQVPAPLPV